MAAHVLRLRLALLFGALRGEPAHVARMVVGLLALALAVGTACWALLTLRSASADVVLAVTVLGGSAVTLGFAVAPLVIGAEDPLDPRRFAVFGLAPGPLAAVLAVAGFLSIPVLALVALGVCLVVVWDAHGVAWPLGAVAVLLGIATCVLLARVSLAVTGLVLAARRSRELAGVFLVAVLVVVVPVGVFLASLDWNGRVPTQLSEAVDVLALTPVGAAWAVPGVREASELAVLPTIAAVLTILALGAVWFLLVRRMLTTTDRPVSGRERGGLGWFVVMPGTPGGAVAARSLVYWMRDGRYLVNVVVVPIAAALTILPLLVVGVPPAVIALVPVPIMALFLGWLPHNDLAYDSTAVWMHLASGLRGAADRVGRLVPIVLISVPLLALTIPVAIWVHGRWAILPALIGVCASLFLAGLGFSSIASVAAPYAVSRPGDSPFQQPQRTGGAGAQGLVFIGAVLVSAPALWWGWLSLTVDASYAWVALWGGIAIGLAVLVLGILIGSRVFERSSSRIMEFAEST